MGLLKGFFVISVLLGVVAAYLGSAEPYMLRMFTATSDSNIKCPGSPSYIHAACKAAARIEGFSCAQVKEEMLARVQGQTNGKWHDSHNNGRYAVIDASSEDSLLLSRRTGDDKYTDKMLFTFKKDGEQSCIVEGCSESQVFSIADFSTNYCNLFIMYCGESEGCPYVMHKFDKLKELQIEPSMGAGKTKESCLSARKP